MSRDGSAILPIGGKDVTVKLAIGEWMKLQEACDAGPQVIVDRLYTEKWKIAEVCEVIRLGLEGGGMNPVEAMHFMKKTVDSQPLVSSLILAQKILQVAYAGVPDEPPGKPQGPDRSVDDSTTFPTGNGGSVPSSAPPT